MRETETDEASKRIFDASARPPEFKRDLAVRQRMLGEKAAHEDRGVPFAHADQVRPERRAGASPVA
jgi:hypothetical protein